MAKMLFHCTHGKEDPERATLPFILGNVAATAGQEAVVFLTVDGVWLATHDYAGGVRKDGLPPLAELIESLVANGGQIWACGACTTPRGIGDADLVAGAKIVAAPNVVEYLVEGAASITF